MIFTGYFSDGRAALRYDVRISFADQALRIEGAGDVPLVWPLADLRVIDADGEAPLRVARRSDDAPRLIVDDPAFRSALFARLPAINPRYGRGRRTLALVAGSLAGVAAFGAALWFGLPLLAKPIAALVPQSVEQRIGRQVADLIVGDFEVCDSPAGERALARLRDRLGASLDRPVPVEVRVVDSPMVNAIAAPGGFIFVFSGLLQKSESPDEIAGVLAHEMGHVVHRHGMQALVHHFALSVVVTLFTGNDWGLGSNALHLLVQFAHTRAAEAEADGAAIDILARAGLRADGLAAFFARIESEEQARRTARGGDDAPDLWRYLSTHPPTGERRAMAAKAGTAGDTALSQREWAALRAICKEEPR